jgi:hypothetical protein
MAPHLLFGIAGFSLTGLAKDIADVFFSTASALFGDGASALVGALVGFIAQTSAPIFSGGWWSSSGEHLFTTVLGVSGGVLALSFMLSVITAVVSTDQQLFARAVRRLPLAVIQMGLLVAVVGALLSATDEISASIIAGASRPLDGFAAVALGSAVTHTGIVGLGGGALIILASICVWLELLCRTALLYVAVLCGPLIFAASVHPSVHGLQRRYVEGCLALICSKIVIALALATGAALLTGVPASADFDQAVGALMEAIAVLAIACFAPFIVLRLLVGAEAVVLAEGLSRRPFRAATMSATTMASLSGLPTMLRSMQSSGSTASDPRSTPPPPRGPSAAAAPTESTASGPSPSQATNGRSTSAQFPRPLPPSAPRNDQ